MPKQQRRARGEGEEQQDGQNGKKKKKNKQQDQKGGGEESNLEFAQLEKAPLASFASAQLADVQDTVSIPPRQISHETILSLLTSKLMFQPLGRFQSLNFQEEYNNDNEGEQQEGEEQKEGKNNSQNQNQNQNNKRNNQNEDEDDEDEDEHEDVADFLKRHCASAQATSNSFGLGNNNNNNSVDSFNNSMKQLPQRIICGIVELVDLKTNNDSVASSLSGVSSAGAREAKIRVDVVIRVQTVMVLQEGLCVGKVSFADSKNNNNSNSSSGIPLLGDFGIHTSLRCQGKGNFVLATIPYDGPTIQLRQFKSNNNNKNEDNKKSGGEEEERGGARKKEPDNNESTFGQRILGGKMMLVSIEDGGRSWKMHLGLTSGENGNNQHLRGGDNRGGKKNTVGSWSVASASSDQSKVVVQWK